MNWIKDFFSDDGFFEMDDTKAYTTKELLDILENKTLSVGQGNKIVLQILKDLVNKE